MMALSPREMASSRRDAKRPGQCPQQPVGALSSATTSVLLFLHPDLVVVAVQLST